MFSLFFLIAFEGICIMLLLWIYGVAKKEEKIKEETKIAQCFIRGQSEGFWVKIIPMKCWNWIENWLIVKGQECRGRYGRYQ